MNLLIRLLWTLLVARFRPPCDVFGPCVTPFRVLPTDLDPLLHMNNGVYLSILDVARVDLMLRAGLGKKLRERGFYPVVAAETIRFRRSLQPFRRFDVETRVIGWDERAILLEQRFVSGGELMAEAVIRSRFLRKGGGTVPADEILALAGRAGPSPELPAWIAAWNAENSTPPRAAQSGAP